MFDYILAVILIEVYDHGEMKGQGHYQNWDQGYLIKLRSGI
jgi:hypothetical protein